MNKVLIRGLLHAAIGVALTVGAATSALADPPAGRGHGQGGVGIDPGGQPDVGTLPGNRNGQNRDDSENGPGNGHNGDGNGNGNRNGNADRDDDDDNPGRGNGHARLHRGNAARACGADDVIEGPDGQSGASHVAHVNFTPVANEGGDTTDDPWARMMYFWIGSEFSFVLNAHDVEPGSAWTLVAQIEGEDGAIEAVCLGDGTANPGGQLHIHATFDPESNLPPSFDPFAEDTDENDDADEVTLSLVSSDAIDCETGALSGDAGDVVLESEDGIRFVDTDELVCPSDG